MENESEFVPYRLALHVFVCFVSIIGIKTQISIQGWVSSEVGVGYCRVSQSNWNLLEGLMVAVIDPHVWLTTITYSPKPFGATEDWKE